MAGKQDRRENGMLPGYGSVTQPAYAILSLLVECVPSEGVFLAVPQCFGGVLGGMMHDAMISLATYTISISQKYVLFDCHCMTKVSRRLPAKGN